MFDDTYKTVAAHAEGIYKDKGSKFIAYIYPVKSEAEVKEYLIQLKKEHHSARHHCFAYRLQPDKSIYRANDDGEPSGTAGKPILGQIQSHDLTDVLIVVVRYFGGTLLGVPGLIKAYKSAAADAISNAEISIKTITRQVEITCNYLQLNDVMKIIKQENLTILKQDTEPSIKLVIEVRISILERVLGMMKKLEEVKIQEV